MQGIAALNPQSQVQPYSAQDFKSMAHAVSTTYDGLSPEQKQALSGLASEIQALPAPKLKVFDQLLTFLEQHAEKYKEVVAELVRQGAVDEGDMPEQYNRPIFATIHSMVRDAMKNAPPEQAYAKGGAVSLHQSADRLRAAGRGEDTILAHINPSEAALLKARGGSGDINPATGLPEFGIFKSIGKFLGSAAPIIGSVLGSFVGMPFLGAVIGGGIGGLASGGGVKGALLGAAMGGVGSLAFGGISSMINGGGFMEGITNTLPSYLGGSGESFGGSLFGNTAGAGQTPTPQARPDSFGPTVGPSTTLSESELADAAVRNGTPNDVAKPTVNPSAGASGSSGTAAKTSFLDNPMDWIKEHPWQTAALGGGALLAANSLGQKPKAATPLSVSNPGLTQSERQAKYPWTVVDQSKFTNNYTPPVTGPQYAWQQGVYESPKFTAAKGGIADVRTGGHLEGLGTGTSDSIPAKLSDGEFVMTARAVRGAGGGDRMKGAKKMYELMHKFERTA